MKSATTATETKGAIVGAERKTICTVDKNVSARLQQWCR